MSQPDIDPYLTLGVPKDATLTEVRAAHRKRVLKCHPDKIQDQAQRDAAQEEFQEVQAAYELLSDPTRRLRYDQKTKLQELRRELEKKRRAEEAEMAARGMPTAREMREGHPVEVRVPFDTTYFEEQRFTEEPRSFSRKNDDFGGKRPKAKEEKKKTKVPPSSERAAKESRENTKAEHSERQRRRDRERRGQQSEKYESFGPFVVSDGGSDSSDSEAYNPKPSRRSREPRESRSRPAESSSRRHERPVYEDDQYHEKVSRAEEHIERSKYDNYRPRTSPQRSRGYESAEPETTPRRSGRSSRANPVRSSSRHNSSYEDLEPRYDSGKPPKIPTATTMPGPKTSLRPTLFGAVRSATTAGYSRPARESSRTRTDDNPLSKMVNDIFPPRSSKLREKYDSGYSSPNTPELAPKGSPKVAARYKIDPEPIIIEPSKPSRHRTLSPERERERVPRMAPPKRASTTQSYMSESGPRVEVRTVRSSARPSRTHANVEYSPQIRSEDVRYTQEIRPGDVNMSPGHNYYYSDHIRTRRPSVAYA